MCMEQAPQSEHRRRHRALPDRCVQKQEEEDERDEGSREPLHKADALQVEGS